MTDISLIYPRSNFLIEPATFAPLGILYISSALKKRGYSVQCLDLNLKNHALSEAEGEIIGISITSPQRLEAYKLVKKYKDEGRIVIVGGPHATHMPEECLENGADYVLRGEAEMAMPIVVHSLLKEKMKGDLPKIINCIEPDINSVPFPDRHAVPLHDYTYSLDDRPATIIMTSRGCRFNCSFCSKTTQNYRMCGAPRVLDELYTINREFGYSAFMIFDDIFIANIPRLRTIADALKNEDFIFRCFARSNMIKDKTCYLMNKLGVVEVGLGIESGSTAVLKKNMKGTTKETNTKAVKLLKKFGIRAKAFLIVGLPGETEGTIKETMDWIEETNPYDIDISLLQPMPGSDLFKNPDKWGIKLADYNPSFYKGKSGEYVAHSSTEELSAERLVELRDLLEKKYKKKELLK